MGNDLERLNRLLDDLAAERDVAERAALSATDVELAERRRSSRRWMPRA